ncbi:MAG: glycosyltransferase family 4 protein [bacterium]|nr:glycosyltransferase family 4 protein [bacterium]
MKILICAGFFTPDVGSHVQYAKNIYSEFLSRGHAVKVAAYRVEKKLPTGIRHLVYFLRVVFSIFKVDTVIALDTFSVGLPAACACKIFGKKFILRVGGDFLWESYVESTRNLITLKDFNAKIRNINLSFKHKIIFWLSGFTMRNADAVVFNSAWQAGIFKNSYGLNPEKLFVVENYLGERITGADFKEKNFFWVGRQLKLKNIELLQESFLDAQKENAALKLELSGEVSNEELLKKIQSCYAVILPSISDISPNFILAAIRCGKPAILTKETGLYEKLQDVAVFIDPFSREDIKKKILFLADDKNYEEYKKRVDNFNFQHSWQEIANEFLEIVKKI